MDNALVPAQNFSLGVDKIALTALTCHALDIGGVITFGEKADFLAVLSVCRGNSLLCRKGADLWLGETAAKYLWRRAESMKGDLNLHRHILWLDWSPERLKLLLEMYPQAQWLDCTQKKLFDAQLREEQ